MKHFGFRNLMIIFCLSLANVSAFANPSEYHVVLDIDWTLYKTSSPEAVAMDPQGIVEVNNVLYRPRENVADFLVFLHQTLGVQVTFFSGGEAGRNQILVDHLYQMVFEKYGLRFAPRQIFSKNNLAIIPTQNPNPRFADRYRKDLKVMGSIPLQKILLVDDTKAFSPQGQENNMLHLPDTMDDIPQFEKMHLLRINASYAPRSYQAWYQERHLLKWVMGILRTSFKTAQTTGDWPQALQEVLKQDPVTQARTSKSMMCRKIY